MRVAAYMCVEKEGEGERGKALRKMEILKRGSNSWQKFGMLG